MKYTLYLFHWFDHICIQNIAKYTAVYAGENNVNLVTYRVGPNKRPFMIPIPSNYFFVTLY